MTDDEIRGLTVLAARIGAALGYAIFDAMLQRDGLTPRELVATTVAAVVALAVVLSAGWVARGVRRDD
jgi:hypothetical protein